MLLSTAIRRYAPQYGIAAITLLLGAACSAPGEDVRVTLCKDIVKLKVGNAVQITGAEARTRGYEHAEVRVSYGQPDGSGNDAGSCFYNHNAVEDTAQQLADPLSAYSASPYKVIIAGQALSKPELAKAIKQAMINQGKALAERL